MHASALPLLLWACTPDEPPATPDTDAADTAADPPLDYIDVAPQWSAEEAVGVVASAFDHGWPDPRLARNNFLELMANGDAECPGNDLAYIDTLDGCWSDSGYWYMGLGQFSLVSSEQSVDGVPYLQEDLRTVNGDFEILTPEGTEYTSGGVMDMTRSTFSDHAAATIMARGSWQWTGSDREWFAAGISADLRVVVLTGGADEGIVVNGTYGVDHHYLTFTELGIGGATCGWQPNGGTIALRQDDQTATTLTFADDCTGCATVSWEGEEVGQACADWSAHAQDLVTTAVGAP